jgi:hypothetical protein
MDHRQVQFLRVDPTLDPRADHGCGGELHSAARLRSQFPCRH